MYFTLMTGIEFSVIKRELVDDACKYLAYDGILEVIKNSTTESNSENGDHGVHDSTRTIGLDDAMKEDYCQNKEVSHYLGYSHMSTILLHFTDSTVSGGL